VILDKNLWGDALTIGRSDDTSGLTPRAEGGAILCGRGALKQKKNVPFKSARPHKFYPFSGEAFSIVTEGISKR